MIDEATVDAYGQSEQLGGFYTMIEEHLAVPFETTLLGVPVTVSGVDLTERDEIVAICAEGASGRRFQSSTLCSRHRHPQVPSGLRPTATGLAEADRWPRANLQRALGRPVRRRSPSRSAGGARRPAFCP